MLLVQLSVAVNVYNPSVPWQLAFALIMTLFWQVNVGGVTSFNVTVIVHVEVLPLPSLAVSVTVWAVLWPVRIVAATGLWITVGEGLQLSLKLAAIRVPTIPWQLVLAATVAFGGQVIEGGVTSFNVTVSVQLAVLPLPSLAVSVTVWALLWPVRTVLDEGLCVTEGLALQLSLNDAGLYDPTWPWHDAFAFTVAFGGQVIEGGTLSLTDTTNVQVPVFDALSVDDSVTV